MSLRFHNNSQAECRVKFVIETSEALCVTCDLHMKAFKRQICDA
jgi:hypothetical protein